MDRKAFEDQLMKSVASDLEKAVRPEDPSSAHTDASVNPSLGGKYGKVHGGNPKKPTGELQDHVLETVGGKPRKRVSGASSLRAQHDVRQEDGREVEKSDEVLKVHKNGQWSLEKSSYGPKKIGSEAVSLYVPKDNVGRKANRTGQVYETVGQNAAEHRYTSAPQGTAVAQASREAKADQVKSAKNPVKVYSEEEKAAFKAKLERK